MDAEKNEENDIFLDENDANEAHHVNDGIQ
jgi:hypothetical protein